MAGQGLADIKGTYQRSGRFPPPGYPYAEAQAGRRPGTTVDAVISSIKMVTQEQGSAASASVSRS